MTTKVMTCRWTDTVSLIMEKMTEGKFRHLPVVEERRVVKPITPAVARKALKAKGKTLDEKYVEEGKSSGSTLAREESARPAIETYRAAAARLGEKLAALTSG